MWRPAPTACLHTHTPTTTTLEQTQHNLSLISTHTYTHLSHTLPPHTLHGACTWGGDLSHTLTTFSSLPLWVSICISTTLSRLPFCRHTYLWRRLVAGRWYGPHTTPAATRSLVVSLGDNRIIICLHAGRLGKAGEDALHLAMANG